MGVITFWNRLEPRPRTASLEQSLGARVFDPLWFLTRQWQFGEFEGHDAGSPKYVEFTLKTAPLEWQRTNPADVFSRLDRSRPFETVEAENWQPNLFLRAELGQALLTLLEAEGAGALFNDFLLAYPLPDESELHPKDSDSIAFLRLCRGRVVDGYALYEACVRAAPDLPAQPALAESVKTAAGAALKKLLEWGRGLFGTFGSADAPAWRPERLEYQTELAACALDGGPASLVGSPTPDGQFDWSSFDWQAPGDGPPASPQTRRVSLIPAHVRFQGMPNPRWWDFETAVRDFGAIDPQRRDLAKLTLMDFMLVHGNDWFCLPLSLPVGSLAWIEEMVVHDVFGRLTVVKSAEQATPSPAQKRWSLFTASVKDDPRHVTPMLVLPPGSGSAIQVGPSIEEVRFFRDEMAEMAWAVEETTENRLGHPWSGHERGILGRPPDANSTPDTGRAAAPLSYRIQTEVPEHWIPFVPVSIDPAAGTIRWERTVLVHDGKPAPPVGRILRPAPTPFQIEEEEIPRTGLKLTRRICYSRWIDGTTHLWIARTRRPGAGEGSSALRYDLTVVNPPADDTPTG